LKVNYCFQELVNPKQQQTKMVNRTFSTLNKILGISLRTQSYKEGE